MQEGWVVANLDGMRVLVSMGMNMNDEQAVAKQRNSLEHGSADRGWSDWGKEGTIVAIFIRDGYPMATVKLLTGQMVEHLLTHLQVMSTVKARLCG